MVTAAKKATHLVLFIRFLIAICSIPLDHRNAGLFKPRILLSLCNIHHAPAKSIPGTEPAARAIQRLMEARILNVDHGPANPAYCHAVKEKFGTEIIALNLPALQKAYEAADRGEAMADKRRWVKEATKIVEPTKKKAEAYRAER